MTETIKLFFVIIFIVILLRLNLDLGIAMLLSSVLLGFVFHLGFSNILNSMYLTMIDPATLELIGIVVLVYVLSSILRRTKSMEGIVFSLQNLISDYRLILFFIASFLGLIPMPAGAMFSAPLLREIGLKNNMNPENLMFSNYWFRHVWEFVWPLMPGLVLYASFIGLNLREVMIIQFPLTIIALILGFIWMYTHLEKGNNNKLDQGNFRLGVITFLKSVWPILLIIFLVLFFKANLLFALAFTIFILLFIGRITISKFIKIIFQDVSIKVVVMIVGIMFFKQVLENTNSMNQIPLFFSAIGINVWIILFFIPFLTAFLTGITTGFIAISFPVLMPIITQGGSPNMSMAIFAYLAGFSGMMISPMHLCLTLTMEYFKVNMIKFYKKLFTHILILIFISSLYVFLLHVLK